MAEISQRTIAAMMVGFRALGIFEPSWQYDPRPAVTPDNFKRFLYSRDFERPLLEEFERRGWNFDDILPAVADGSLKVRPSRHWRQKAEQRLRGQDEADALLRELAAALLLTGLQFRSPAILKPIGDVYDALKSDGLGIAHGRIVELDTAIVDLPRELSELEAVIEASKHDNGALLLEHLRDAERHLGEHDWRPAMLDFRNLFEETLRGAWRYTRAHNSAFAGFIAGPGFADVLLWLTKANFVTEEEAKAYGAAWGYLSVGTHPGVKDQELATFSRFLAFPLAHSALLKLSRWDGTSYKS